MFGEAPHHDAGLSQRLKHPVRLLAPHQAEQRGAADHLEPRFDETGIEPQRCIGELRGPVLWSETMSARASSFGDRDLFICATPSRAYDIDENRILVAALDTSSRSN